MNLIERNKEQKGSSEWDDNKVVLHVHGKGTPIFVMKCKINNTPFKILIDSGSLITIFTQAEVRRILNQALILARPLPRGEEYLDYNRKGYYSGLWI